MRWRSLAVVFACLVGLFAPVGYEASAAAPTSAFSAVTPVRVLNAVGALRVEPNMVQYLTVAGLNGVPLGATAAVINVTAAAGAKADLRVSASGAPEPRATTMLVTPGGPVTQMLVVPLGVNGKLEFRTNAAVDVFADLYGYFSPAVTATRGRFIAAGSPSTSSVTVGAGGIVTIDLRSSTPNDVDAVLVSVAVRGPAGGWSSSGLDVATSRPGETVVNRFVVKGRVLSLMSAAGGDVTVDVLGWFTGASAASSSEGLFVPMSPLRVFDTTGAPDPLGVGVALHAGWTAETSFALAGAGLVLVNTIVTSAHGPGDVIVHAAGRDRGTAEVMSVPRPGFSATGQTVVPMSDRTIAVWSAGGGEVALDLMGWFTGTPLVATNSAVVNALPTPDLFPGLLWIPSLKLFTAVRENIDLVNFDPVHIPESRSPNQPGNVAIFGHRTSHGREFRNLDRLKVGAPIVLATNGRVYTYSVVAVGVLEPDDPFLWASLSNDQTLTLVACHPPGSVKFRIVVFARLVSVS